MAGHLDAATDSTMVESLDDLLGVILVASLAVSLVVMMVFLQAETLVQMLD